MRGVAAGYIPELKAKDFKAVQATVEYVNGMKEDRWWRFSLARSQSRYI